MATIEYKGIKIFAFSDTHHLHDKLEIPKDIDISICVGDVESEIGTSSLDEFAYWYSKFPAQAKLFIPGNHDLSFEFEPHVASHILRQHGIQWLQKHVIDIYNLSFYALPATPWLHSPEELPANLDILATRGPANGILDMGLGCKYLRDAIDKTKPQIHIFGHIHQCGEQHVHISGIDYYNVSKYNSLNRLQAVKH